MSHTKDSGCARGLCRTCNDEETIARLTKERDEARALLQSVLVCWRACCECVVEILPTSDDAAKAWLALEVAMKKLEDACDRSP